MRGIGKVVACRNGGSAAQAQHIVAELVGRLSVERTGLPAVCQVFDGVFLSALDNDSGYHEVFARQLTVVGAPGRRPCRVIDEWALTQRVAAVAAARSQEMPAVGMTRRRPIPLFRGQTAHIQEIRTALVRHDMSGVERLLYGRQ